MAFPLPTELVNETSGLMEGFSIWAYQVSNGTFFTMLLLGFCVVLYIATSRYEGDRALGFAGTAGLFGSLILATLGLMPWIIATGFILAGGFGIAYMVLNK